MQILESSHERLVKSADYNSYFNKETGFFARWGQEKRIILLMLQCQKF